MAITERGSWVGIRSFEQSGRPWVLAVNFQTLETMVFEDNGTFLASTWRALEERHGLSPWFRARADAAQHAASLQDAGLTHLLPTETGIASTVDLCPSTKHFDMRIVQKLLEIIAPAERPIPVAFALSGVWLLEHPDDFEKLRAMDGKALAITWINHSMHHRYSQKARERAAPHRGAGLAQHDDRPLSPRR